MKNEDIWIVEKMDAEIVKASKAGNEEEAHLWRQAKMRFEVLCERDAVSVPKSMLEASEIGMRSALNFEQFQHAGSVVALAREKLNNATIQLELANIRYRHREFISQSDPATKIACGNPALRPKLINAVNWLMTGRLPEAK